MIQLNRSTSPEHAKGYRPALTGHPKLQFNTAKNKHLDNQSTQRLVQTINQTGIDTNGNINHKTISNLANQDLAKAALSESPTEKISAPDGSAPIKIFNSSAAHAVADKIGAFGFAYNDSVFLGSSNRFPGAPDKEQVLQHEITHVLQSRKKGPVAHPDALEKQAPTVSNVDNLLSADPDEIYPFLWVPFVIAAGYIFLKPSVANAPGPNSKTYKSMGVSDYAKTIAEATVFASGGAIVSGLRKAGYSIVTTWAVSGAAGSVSYRGIQDIHSGSFSGADTYVIDGLTGATIGVVVGGTFYAIGKVPGISRTRDWFMQGSKNDTAWSKLGFKDKLRYEIGQKTLSNADDFAKLSGLTPVERGAEIIKQKGWLKALMPESTKFLPGSTGGTFSTGPTPLGRLFMRSSTGFSAGAAGNYMLDNSVQDFYGTGVAPIVVVPQGKELEYYLKTGRLGDFPVPENAPSMHDMPFDALGGIENKPGTPTIGFG